MKWVLIIMAWATPAPPEEEWAARMAFSQTWKQLEFETQADCVDVAKQVVASAQGTTIDRMNVFCSVKDD